jgi:hypothetical protein
VKLLQKGAAFTLEVNFNNLGNGNDSESFMQIGWVTQYSPRGGKVKNSYLSGW